jgi:hypothetical protein
MSSPSPDVAAARGPFAESARVYSQRGNWPRPITIGSKACHVRDWQRPDHEIPAAELASWPTKYGPLGIGLLMGSPFPDGTTLGALDIDRDEYVRVGRALLNNPVSGRIGKRGAVFFVRVRGRLSNPESGARATRSPSASSPRNSASSRRRSTPTPDRPTAGSGRPCTRSTSTNCQSWR